MDLFEVEKVEIIMKIMNMIVGIGSGNMFDKGFFWEMIFNDDNVMFVIVYVCFFFFVVFGNLIVLVILLKSWWYKLRVNIFIMYLFIVDLIVVFIMLLLEIVWYVIVVWEVGDVVCCIFMFFCVFGFYLFLFVLVVISLDCYFFIVYFLSIYDVDRRGKIMFIMVWLLSIIVSLF